METTNIVTRKYKLISLLMRIDNEYFVQLIEEFFEKLISQKKVKTKDENEIFKPMREDLTISDIKREQNYQAINLNSFNKIVAEINVQESLSELLSIK